MKRALEEVRGESLLSLTYDAKLVALRWDLVAFGLVWDLDVSCSEKADAPMRRGWICFCDVSELNWPLDKARLPIGCWLTSVLEVIPGDGLEIEYRVAGLFSRFENNRPIPSGQAKEISVYARSIWGVISTEPAPSTELGLDLEIRRSLAAPSERPQ